MFKCVFSEFGEGFYSSVEQFEEMCEEAFEYAPDLLSGPDNGYYAIIDGTHKEVLRKLYFVLRDGEPTNSNGYPSFSLALEAAEDLFGELFCSDEFDRETAVKTVYGDLTATQAICCAGSDEDLATSESISCLIVW